MAAALVLMLLGTPIYDSFDEPLDPVRWYVGTGLPPAKGVLRLQKSGWIVSRHVPDDTVRRIDVVFRHRGGDLELTFHDAREPLSSPKGTALRVKKGAGERRLVVTREGATVDGADVDWKGELLGTFRLCAARGDVELL